MKRAVLVCNGSVNTKYLYSHIGKGDFLIAVDGGANKLMKTKFVPNLIIGDLDSISKNALKKFRHVEIKKFPVEKDKLDLELAIDYCVENKFNDLVILGAVGTRADMTLTNVFSLLQIPGKIGSRIIHDDQEIFLVKKKCSLEGIPGERISLFPINGGIKNLSLKGFRYNIKNFDLEFGIGKGISNAFKNKKASITFKDGQLLCVHFKKTF